jgi:hypothetical protein
VAQADQFPRRRLVDFSTRLGYSRAAEYDQKRCINPSNQRRYASMSEACCGLKLGANVPVFEMATYDPVKDDFGKFSMQEQINNKRWTILFFYPADFTFV